MRVRVPIGKRFDPLCKGGWGRDPLCERDGMVPAGLGVIGEGRRFWRVDLLRGSRVIDEFDVCIDDGGGTGCAGGDRGRGGE